ncbi:putative rRNA maturation factor [Amorphus suaedae]
MTGTGMPATAPVSAEVVREAEGWPDESVLQEICDRAIAAACKAGDISLPDDAGVAILFSDDAHVRRLNAEFRDQDKPTNVLSFPASGDGGFGEATHLGDIVLAFETVAAEAESGATPFDHHVAHLVMHGFLHVLGYDHVDEDEAVEMEHLETLALAELGIADPYADDGGAGA